MHNSPEARSASAQNGFRDPTVNTGRPGRARTRVGVILVAMCALLGSGLASVVVASPASAGPGGSISLPPGGGNGYAPPGGGGGGSNTKGPSSAVPNGWGYSTLAGTANFNQGDRLNSNRTALPDRLGSRLDKIPGGKADGIRSYTAAGKPCLSGPTRSLSTSGTGMVDQMAIGVKFHQQILWNGKTATGMRLGFKKKVVAKWDGYNTSAVKTGDFGCVSDGEAFVTDRQCGIEGVTPRFAGPYDNLRSNSDLPDVEGAPSRPAWFVDRKTGANVGDRILGGFGELYNGSSWVPTEGRPEGKLEVWKTEQTTTTRVRVKRVPAVKSKKGKVIKKAVPGFWRTDTTTTPAHWGLDPYPLVAGVKIKRTDVRASALRLECKNVNLRYDADVEASVENVGLWLGTAVGNSVLCSSVQTPLFALTVLNKDGRDTEVINYSPRNLWPNNGCSPAPPTPSSAQMMIFCDAAGLFASAKPGDATWNPDMDFTANRASCGGTKQTSATAVCVVDPKDKTRITYARAKGEPVVMGSGAQVFADGTPVTIEVAEPRGFLELDGDGKPTGEAVTNARSFSTTFGVKELSTPWPKDFGAGPADPVSSDKVMDFERKYPESGASVWENNIVLRFFKGSSPTGISSTEVSPFTLVVTRSFLFDKLVQKWFLSTDGTFRKNGPPETAPTPGNCTTEVELTAVSSRVSN